VIGCFEVGAHGEPRSRARRGVARGGALAQYQLAHDSRPTLGAMRGGASRKGGPASPKAGLAGGFRRPQTVRLAGLGFPSTRWVYYYAERTNITTSQSSKASCKGAFSNSEDPRVARVTRCTHRALANGRGVVSEGDGRRRGSVCEPRRRPAQRGSAPPLAKGPSGCGCGAGIGGGLRGPWALFWSFWKWTLWKKNGKMP